MSLKYFAKCNQTHFKTLKLGVNIINLSTLSHRFKSNKLEHLPMASLTSLVLNLQVRSEPNPVITWSASWYDRPYLKHWTSLERLAKDSTAHLFKNPVSGKEHKLDNIHVNKAKAFVPSWQVKYLSLRPDCKSGMPKVLHKWYFVWDI
jgi:hypothetical protein